MNFTDAVAEIVTSSGRPDKIALARRKLNAAIVFFSLDSSFKRDYKEQQVTTDANEYTQAFALSELTRFRRFHYMKIGGTKLFLTVLPDSELFKCCDVKGRYYHVGDNVNINLQQLTSYLDVGYFQYPTTLTDTAGNNTYWMLDMYPYMLIDYALADVFKEIGDEKSFTALRLSAKEQYLAFRKDQEIMTQ